MDVRILRITSCFTILSYQEQHSQWDSETDGGGSLESSPSSVWTENTNHGDRSSRRALILQMAKARMRSTRAGISQHKTSPTKSLAKDTGISRLQQLSKERASKLAQKLVAEVDKDEELEPEHVSSADLDFTADLD